MKSRYTGECRQHPAPPNCEHGVGNGVNILVNLTSVNGVPMDELEFALHFYVYGRADEIRVHKSQMYQASGKYYALLNEKYLPAGWLMCRIEVLEPMAGWPSGLKPATLNCMTGIILGNCTDLYCPMDCGLVYNSNKFVNGYKALFKKVDDLPQPDDSDDEDGFVSDSTMYYGYITDSIKSMGEITAGMLEASTVKKTNSKRLDKTSVGVVPQGGKVIVCVPGNDGLVGMKDNGMGVAVPFDESVMGCNGLGISINGVSYKLYGEFMTVGGEINIHVV